MRLTTTFLIFDAGVSSSDKNLLGEQIAELKGKMTGQRVLDVEGPTTETTGSFNGSFKGTPVRSTVTFVRRPTSAGVLHGEAKGVIMAGDSEVATFTAEGFGRLSPSGSVKWRGSPFFMTSSTGKLSFLNNVVGVFEAEVDPEGNFRENLGMEVAGSSSFSILLPRLFNQNLYSSGISICTFFLFPSFCNFKGLLPFIGKPMP